MEGYYGKSDYGNMKKVGDDEVVVFHPSGKKFVVKVREIEG